jgi:sigma-B regulation protein RsbU (phosphoserine phosphatase)
MWQQRLDQIVVLMREMSSHADPQTMVRAYGERVRSIQANDGFIAVSRRGLAPGQYKVTRATAHANPIDPWKDGAKIPISTHGVLGQWIADGLPRLIQDFVVPPDDPYAPLFGAARSVAIMPQFDNGEALNMVVILKNTPNGFDPERFPELFWQSNLFGRATASLVLSKQLKEALGAIDRELRVVADIQRSLLPTELPTCVGLDIATHYQTSKQAGGDYFDFFELPGGKLGILIADVSGHGTPAAVLMAILHAIAHVNQTWTGACTETEGPEAIDPRQWMAFVNRQLCERYTRLSGTFVTAFYAVYDPASRSLTYASAGHNPPRLRMANAACALSPVGGPIGGVNGQTTSGSDDAGGVLMLPLDEAQGLPLGILPEAEYSQATITLDHGDVLVLYTDGITEAFGPAVAPSAHRELFGTERLDRTLIDPRPTAQAHLEAILASVASHAGPNGSVDDDRTLIVARVQPPKAGVAH